MLHLKKESIIPSMRDILKGMKALRGVLLAQNRQAARGAAPKRHIRQMDVSCKRHVPLLYSKPHRRWLEHEHPFARLLEGHGISKVGGASRVRDSPG